MEVNPRLRVAPMPVEIEGRQMLMFQDPDRFTEETVLMPVEAAAIVQFFDGSKSVREIQEELMRRTGQLIDSDLIQNLADQLDERLLLESPRFFEHVRELNRAWREEPVRKPYHAGDAYPADPAKLATFLDSFYTAPEGPGQPPGETRANDLKAIVAPHMSISDSGACTAHAFKTLAERTEASLFVIFGTAHNEAQRSFVLSDKDFETPLGVAHADRELVDRLTRARSDRNPLNDYIHKQEHSIEFMVVFLQHALKGRDFKILPVLANGTAPGVLTQTPLGGEPAFRDFMRALDRALADTGQKAAFIASADLAHLGPRYGDRETWAPIRMGEEEENDRKMLGHLLAADHDGFFMEVAKNGDSRKICGLAPIYAAVAASRPQTGELLKWSYWHDSMTHSVVTYASMAFY